jgi:hypothetical protein
MKSTLSMLVVACALTLAERAWSQETANVEITDDARAVARGGNEFATELYAKLGAGNSSRLTASRPLWR